MTVPLRQHRSNLKVSDHCRLLFIVVCLDLIQESSSQSSAGELSSSQVELNQNSKPPSRQSSCLSLNSAKVHPEVTSENHSPTPVESPIPPDIVGSDSADVRSGQRENVREVLAAARSEGSQSEIPTYRIYAMSVSWLRLMCAISYRLVF